MKLNQLFESKELVTELLWFQRFIDKHDLDLQIEIEDDKLTIYKDGTLVVTWTSLEANAFRTTSIDTISLYAMRNKQLRVLCEPIIATDGYESYVYAQNILKKRFKLGEKAIATSALQSRFYAQNVLKGRFELGEPVIVTDEEQSRLYKKFLATLK